MAVVGLVSVVVAPVPYFVAFLFAYGFNDQIRPSTHIIFPLEVAVVAVVIALLAMFVVRAAAAISMRRALCLSLWLSLAINLTAVGIGSIVSAYNADQGSVTAEYSLTTDALLAAGLLGSAAVAAWIAFRSRPR